jgi:signal transduction histidine kinase
MRFFRRLQELIVSERGQLIFATVLLVLIPAALVYNTLVAVNAAERNMDIELQRKAFLAERIFQATVREEINDDAALQELVTQVAAASEEIWSIDILRPQAESFTVVASLAQETIGQSTTALNNTIAWQEEETIAYLTSANSLSTIEQTMLSQSNQRFWLVVSPLYDVAGQKQALVSMKISSHIIDNLVRQSITNAIIILIVTVLVVVLLLLTNTRLLRYALLSRKLKEVDQMKDEFISMASHELRTPITGIRGYLDMLLRDDLGTIPPRAKEALVNLNIGAERLSDLIEDLLNVSRIEQGRLEMKFENIEILPVINEVINELMPMASEKSLTLTHQGEQNIPKLYLDRDRMKQVLINIVGNSLKYTEEGSVTIHTEIKNNSLRVMVEDTGIGMSAQATEKLFTKFFRIKSAKTQAIAGTGLGLWITKQLVELMKGAIEAQSIEGKGSQFVITLRLTKKK